MAGDVRTDRGAGEVPSTRTREPRPPRTRDVDQDRSPSGAPRERGGGVRRFVHESVGELRKVEWPTQKHLVSAVLAVIVACVVVGVFLYVADEAFSRLVRDVLLRG